MGVHKVGFIYSGVQNATKQMNWPEDYPEK